MPRPYCRSPRTQEQLKQTSLGYRTFRCAACMRRFDERTGNAFNATRARVPGVPTDIVFLVVLWRLRYPLSLRHLAEMFLEQGLVFSHETVRLWEARVPTPADRAVASPATWHADETYVKVHGIWCSLYRAIDADGNLVDSMLSERRDMDARVPACGCRFFARSLEVVGQVPRKVTRDGHDAYPLAAREILGEGVTHRCSQYMNNRLEQDRRGIQQRYHPMRGFGSFVSAARFRSAHDELRLLPAPHQAARGSTAGGPGGLPRLLGDAARDARGGVEG